MELVLIQENRLGVFKKNDGDTKLWKVCDFSECGSSMGRPHHDTHFAEHPKSLMARSCWDLPRLSGVFTDPLRVTSNLKPAIFGDNFANRKETQKSSKWCYHVQWGDQLFCGFGDVQKPYPLPQGLSKNSGCTRVASFVVKNGCEPMNH